MVLFLVFSMQVPLHKLKSDEAQGRVRRKRRRRRRGVTLSSKEYMPIELMKVKRRRIKSTYSKSLNLNKKSILLVFLVKVSCQT